MTTPNVPQRINPRLAHCGGIRLAFDGKALTMLAARQSVYSYPACSGHADNLGRFDYSYRSQRMRNYGPTPAGTYWLTPDDLWENAFWKIRSSNRAWGNYRIRFHPFPTTETFGRENMFLHGGNRPGSAGCIDLVHYMDQFVSDLRSELKAIKGNCQIHLDVRYEPNFVAKWQG